MTPQLGTCWEAGGYAFFRPVAVRPACGVAPAAPGAAPCAYLAAPSFDSAFGLWSRLRVRAVTAQEGASGVGGVAVEGEAPAGGPAGNGTAGGGAAGGGGATPPAGSRGSEPPAGA